MKRTELELEKPYAIQTPRDGVRLGFILGTSWSAKGEYLGGHAPRAGGALVLYRAEGIKNGRSGAEALKYTENRYRAALAYEAMFGEDEELDGMMLPPRGWVATPVTLADVLMSWDDWEDHLRDLEQQEVEKFKTYRKLRNSMARVVAARDAVSAVSRSVAPAPVIEKVGPAEVARRGWQKRKEAEAVKAAERKALEQSEVSNFERAIRSTTAYLLKNAPEQYKTEDAAHLDAIALVMDVATIVQDEPRTMSARKESVELAASKKAIYDRWLKGNDAEGHDWLESTKPEYVIDIIMSLLIQRGWRPTTAS